MVARRGPDRMRPGTLRRWSGLAVGFPRPRRTRASLRRGLSAERPACAPVASRSRRRHAALARLALPRPLVRNHKLGASLLRYRHRSRAPSSRRRRCDAEILLGFIDLLAGAGATDVVELIALTDGLRPGVLRHLTVANLPASPASTASIPQETPSTWDRRSSQSRVAIYYTKARSAPRCSAQCPGRVRPYPTLRFSKADPNCATVHSPYNSASTPGSQHWVIAEAGRPASFHP